MFKKQAVGYINFRVINLQDNTSTLVQNRYASISKLQTTIEGISNRKTKKLALGSEYDENYLLVDVEDICVASEYGRYLKHLYGREDMVIRFGKTVMTILKKENKIFDTVNNDKLLLDNVQSDKPLTLDRLATKKQYDSYIREVKVEKPKTKTMVEMEGKVSEFAKKHNLYYKKSDYDNVHSEMEWCCKVCETTFSISFKKLKDRKHPCKQCGERHYKNGAVAVRNMKNYATEHGMEVETKNFNEEIGDNSRLMWTCKHGERELLSFRAVKRRYKNDNDKCIVCRVVEKGD